VVTVKDDPKPGGDCLGGIDEVKAEGSSLNSTRIILPCLELGGGGAFLPVESATSPLDFLLSSSGSDISCDVRGDSG
jgi:hypothetical protein